MPRQPASDSARVTSSKPIIVGVDGSEGSFLAVEEAARLAIERAAELIIVEAYEPASAREIARYSYELGPLAYQVAGSCPAEADAREALMYAQRVGATARCEVRRGKPGVVLCQIAREMRAALIVVGEPSHQHLLGGLFSHSTVTAVRGHAPCRIHVVACKGQHADPLYPAYWARETGTDPS